MPYKFCNFEGAPILTKVLVYGSLIGGGLVVLFGLVSGQTDKIVFGVAWALAGLMWTHMPDKKFLDKLKSESVSLAFWEGRCVNCGSTETGEAFFWHGKAAYHCTCGYETLLKVRKEKEGEL